MIIKPHEFKSSHLLTESDVTPESIYNDRRKFMKQGMFALAGGLMASMSPSLWAKKLDYAKTAYGKQDSLTPEEAVTTYNNFYELGTGKDDPANNAAQLKTEGWTIEVEGHAEKTGKFDLQDIIKNQQLEERIYRLRCVEAWSMVIPWVGFSLADMLKQFKPTSKAKYVEFISIHDPKNLKAQGSLFSTIDWPYREGLRMDEAMNELSFMATGLYGKTLPNQNGAPIRLVVPWKYGFKSIKSIVKIRFVEEMPATTWNDIASNEYGFYANVNPQVDHPRWSQASERRLPTSFFNIKKIPTQMFNGYGEQVAYMYKGMDLKRFY
ncbi:protein-methionine-sulfoxide reductase catalytic subunit MsrP [Oceaniserpentilla sp. 4NH20-0058]|uniref:protein-methionine-sulfoxide reductase catalytic subunit MsrP n=1 Tax=Oceaniserpentilla sp. 4NH20-0058 TaxID=3127660 RepID=UPI00310A7204